MIKEIMFDLPKEGTFHEGTIWVRRMWFRIKREKEQTYLWDHGSLDTLGQKMLATLRGTWVAEQDRKGKL